MKSSLCFAGRIEVACCCQLVTFMYTILALGIELYATNIMYLKNGDNFNFECFF